MVDNLNADELLDSSSNVRKKERKKKWKPLSLSIGCEWNMCNLTFTKSETLMPHIMEHIEDALGKFGLFL